MDQEQARTKSGGGSGGGPESGGHVEDVSGNYRIQANQVEVLSRPLAPPAEPKPCVITLLATGKTGIDGRVEVRGSQGVRITAGPPGVPPTTSDSINGVEIIVSDEQTVTIQRGLLPVEQQKIEMTPEGITIDAGMGILTLKSGGSSISLAPNVVMIKGDFVLIN